MFKAAEIKWRNKRDKFNENGRGSLNRNKKEGNWN
jgi:hypothetical protein